MIVPARRRLLMLIALPFLLAACAGGEWETNYGDVVDPQEARNWRVVEVDVQVPETLTVSEANTYAPDADIVWRGDPPGNRYAQVDAIVTTGLRRGAAGLKGRRPVRLIATVTEFHALTEKTRRTLGNAGVHNISFTAQVVDARTGKPLTPPDHIKADLVAYSGARAIEAEREGLTQKVRITNHLARVIAGWLGTGPDVRGTFRRSGR